MSLHHFVNAFQTRVITPVNTQNMLIHVYRTLSQTTTNRKIPLK